MADINKDLLRSKIIHSRELTALEKRYLESLIEQDKPDSPLMQPKMKPSPRKRGDGTGHSDSDVS